MELVNRQTTGDEGWVHFLYAPTRSHQAHFILPERNDKPLRISRLNSVQASQILKFIEVVPEAELPVAPRAQTGMILANLSRGDSQYEAGHGAILVAACGNVHTIRDHVGRGSPPYAYGVGIVNRELDAATIVIAIRALLQRCSPGMVDNRAENPFVLNGRSEEIPRGSEPKLPDVFSRTLHENFADCDQLSEERLALRWQEWARCLSAELPTPTISLPGNHKKWRSAGNTNQSVLYISVPSNCLLMTVVRAAATIAEVFYYSDLSWYAISIGTTHPEFLRRNPALAVAFIPESMQGRLTSEARCIPIAHIVDGLEVEWAAVMGLQPINQESVEMNAQMRVESPVVEQPASPEALIQPNNHGMMMEITTAPPNIQNTLPDLTSSVASRSMGPAAEPNRPSSSDGKIRRRKEGYSWSTKEVLGVALITFLLGGLLVLSLSMNCRVTCS